MSTCSFTYLCIHWPVRVCALMGGKPATLADRGDTLTTELLGQGRAGTLYLYISFQCAFSSDYMFQETRQPGEIFTFAQASHHAGCTTARLGTPSLDEPFPARPPPPGLEELDSGHAAVPSTSLSLLASSLALTGSALAAGAPICPCQSRGYPPGATNHSTGISVSSPAANQCFR